MSYSITLQPLGIILISLLVAGCGGLLGYLSTRIKKQADQLVNKIDRLLPQTQCAQCGYSGCRPYAQAIAEGQADINQCPPGGQQTIDTLANLLGAEPTSLNTQFGETKDLQLAVITESECIGCTLCIKACPVDAILGANQQMHTVIAQECTGCELCVAPCPVDCIIMIPVSQGFESL
ncbi:MAG TPA: electron transport complex subunit RsxB [Crenotrichaceae bacterium]|nr:electron transport complex subunit RsxB [Crenotrichaceae bacterium]